MSDNTKLLTTIEGMTVEISYYKTDGGQLKVEAILNTPKGRRACHFFKSPMLLDDLEELKREVAQAALDSYRNGGRGVFSRR